MSHGGEPLAAPGHPRRGLRERAPWLGRLLGVVAAACVAGLIGGGQWVNTQWTLAQSDTCDVWEPVDITIEELIALKRRKNAWQAAMDDTAWFDMSDTEVNFLLRGMTDYEILASFQGDVVEAHITAPNPQGCYNVRYRGVAAVHDGVVIVVPETLIVGRLDLTAWVAGRRFSADGPQLTGWVDERVLSALHNAQDVEVVDSRLRMRLFDRRLIW